VEDQLHQVVAVALDRKNFCSAFRSLGSEDKLRVPLRYQNLHVGCCDRIQGHAKTDLRHLEQSIVFVLSCAARIEDLECQRVCSSCLGSRFVNLSHVAHA
jgi:hypothetical protein